MTTTERLNKLGCNETETNKIISWFQDKGIVSTIGNACLNSSGLRFFLSKNRGMIYKSEIIHGLEKCERLLIEKLTETLWTI